MRSIRDTSFRGALLASAFALAAFATSAQAQSYDLRVVHNFSGVPDDGMFPMPGVRFDSAGNLYGTTQYGGAFDGGTIYKIAKDGTRSILHSFEPLHVQDVAEDPNNPNVVDPNSIVIDSSTGDIYGSTNFGGDMSGGGGVGHCGSIGGGQIYKLAADGTFTTLFAFSANSTGVSPSSLIRDPQGNLYGMLGCSDKYGSSPFLFKYGVDGAVTVLHAFGLSSPVGSVIRDGAGNLYGVTTKAGRGGAIYRVAPDGTFTTLYSFANQIDGTPTSGLAGDRAGNLYGATMNSAPANRSDWKYWSTVFKLAPDGTFTTLYTSPLQLNNELPRIYAVLAVDGTLYGLSSDYSISPPYRTWRTLFTIAPDGSYTKLHDFLETYGYGNFADSGPLVLQHGRVYGTIKSAGISSYGTIFSLGVDTQ